MDFLFCARFLISLHLHLPIKLCQFISSMLDNVFKIIKF